MGSYYSEIDTRNTVKTAVPGGVTGTDIAGSKRALDIAVKESLGLKLATSATSTIETIAASSTTVASVAGQQSMTIINLEAGKVHYKINGTATTSFASLRKGDILRLIGYSGSVQMIAASGTNDVHVDRFIA